MKRLLAIAAITAAAIGVGSSASAQTEGCEVVDYQGAPTEICPEREPDPTNCYTGDFQGVPIEVCMPVGEQVPDDWTIDGQPIVTHNAANYTPPTSVPVAVVAPVAPPVVEVSWLDELQAILVAAGGW